MSLKKRTIRKPIQSILVKQNGTKIQIGQIIKNSGRAIYLSWDLFFSEFVCDFYEKWNQFYVLDILEETAERPPELDKLIERKLGSDCFSQGSTNKIAHWQVLLSNWSFYETLDLWSLLSWLEPKIKADLNSGYTSYVDAFYSQHNKYGELIKEEYPGVVDKLPAGEKRNWVLTALAYKQLYKI